jgi:hypothetical protein
MESLPQDSSIVDVEAGDSISQVLDSNNYSRKGSEISVSSSATTSKRKRAQTSEAWVYFKMHVWTADQKSALCTVEKCSKREVSLGKDGSPSSLFKHLAHNHKDLYSILEHYKKKARKLEEEREEMIKLEATSKAESTRTQLSATRFFTPIFNQKVFNGHLTKWVVEDVLPFTSFESTAAREVFKYLNHTAHPISGDSIKARVVKAFEESTELVKVGF